MLTLHMRIEDRMNGKLCFSVFLNCLDSGILL